MSATGTTKKVMVVTIKENRLTSMKQGKVTKMIKCVEKAVRLAVTNMNISAILAPALFFVQRQPKQGYKSDRSKEWNWLHP